MKWSVAILAFVFCSRVLFVLNMAGKQSWVGVTAGWAWLKVRRIDALHANLCIFIIDVIDDVDESLQPYNS